MVGFRCLEAVCVSLGSGVAESTDLRGVMSRVELPAMELTDVGGIELEVHDRGSGEPVVFVHAMRADWHGVLAEPALAEQHRLVYYHRRGFGRSSAAGLPLTVAQQAADCRAVLRHLGIEKAHVVGLSAGGGLVLQFAVDFPDAAHTIAVLEPTIPGLLSEDPEAEQMQAEMAERFEAGDTAGALEVMLRTMGGADYAADFEGTQPPGWFDRMVADWETFRHDVAALGAWEFTEKDAAKITAPVLNMKASDSGPRHQAYHRTIRSWIPHAQSAVVPDSTHFMPHRAPRKVAELLTAFFSRHPMHS